jgi:hypothetical protein
MGMGMGVNPYPPVYIGDPMGLFLCRGYEYRVVIPGGYLPIAISSSYVLPCLGLKSQWHGFGGNQRRHMTSSWRDIKVKQLLKDCVTVRSKFQKLVHCASD